MCPIISVLLGFVAGLCQSRASLGMERLALRHQVAVYQQTVDRARLRGTDWVFWGGYPGFGGAGPMPCSASSPGR
jgi:hypothetical protein